MSESIFDWIDSEVAKADRMAEEGSYDGEDYWRGASDILTELKNKLNAGEVSV